MRCKFHQNVSFVSRSTLVVLAVAYQSNILGKEWTCVNTNGTSLDMCKHKWAFLCNEVMKSLAVRVIKASLHHTVSSLLLLFTADIFEGMQRSMATGTFLASTCRYIRQTKLFIRLLCIHRDFGLCMDFCCPVYPNRLTICVHFEWCIIGWSKGLSSSHGLTTL